MLSDLMSAGDAESGVHLGHVLLVPLVEVDIAPDRFIHFRLPPSGLRDDHILVGLLLHQDGGRRVQEGAPVLTAQEREGVPDTACLRSEY